jgi:hypothetical protein
VWDLSSTLLLGFMEVTTGGGNAQFRFSDCTADGQAYRGGAGNDSFTFGSQDARLFVGSADTGFDSFAGNSAATNTLFVDDANTQVGIGTNYGGANSVDVIYATGKANASLVGSSGSHDVWDLSGTDLKNITAVSVGGGNDTVQTALMDAADPHITYDGGAYTLDKLVISLTGAQAGNAALMAQIAALTPGAGVNGNLSAGGMNLTAQGWESFAVEVQTDDGFQPLNILFGTANHQNGVASPVLSVPGAQAGQSWAIFGLGGDDIITGGNNADFIDGGGGSDTMNGDDGDDTFIVATAPPPAAPPGYDTFNGGAGDDRIVSGDGSDILVGFGSISWIEEISGGGFSGVDIVTNPSAHVALDLTGTKLRAIDLVYAAGTTTLNTIRTSGDSDAAGGQAYRGGAGNDSFVLGGDDTRLLVYAADTGFDSFSGNSAGAEHRIVVAEAGTAVGLGTNYGGANSVDVVDATGKANASIVGSTGSHDVWDLSGTDLINIGLVSTAGGNDSVKTALMAAGDAPISYDGGTGSLDHLTISLTSTQATDGTVLADLAALTPGAGSNGTVDAGGLDLTATGWETIDWIVV